MSSEGMIFFVTVPNIELGEKLAYGLLEKKIVACVNIIKEITSIYTWKNKIEKDEECLMIIKTFAKKAKDLINFIEKNHTYDVPECIGVRIEKGLEKYLNWIEESMK